MPLSNQKGEGFEKKIAELIAKEWNAKIEYAWWPVRRGFFSRALNGRYCDLAIQAPGGLDMAGATTPYFRSGYVFLTRQGQRLATSSRWPIPGSRSCGSASTCSTRTQKTRRPPWR